MSEQPGFQLTGSAADHYHFVASRYIAPLAERMVDAVVSSGQSVLDVACGTGFASRAAAMIVGGSGRVVGVDVNPTMLTTAGAMPDPSPIPIVWQEAPAEELPFHDDEFDCAVCSQGVQFFSDPVAGLAEMVRVTRPGGTVAATVWMPLEQNPFFVAQHEMMVEHCGVDPAQLGRAFSRGGDEVARWFNSAGLSGVVADEIEIVVSLPPVREFVPRSVKALPWGGAFDALDSQSKDDALGFLERRLQAYGSASGTPVPFRSVLALGVVPT